MPILASEALLCENKEITVTKYYPYLGLNPVPLILSLTLSFLDKLGKCYLNFCLCITWFWNLDDLVRISTAGYTGSLKSQFYKQCKVSSEKKSVTRIFCFHVVQHLMPILALLQILSSLWKILPFVQIDYWFRTSDFRTNCWEVM